MLKYFPFVLFMVLIGLMGCSDLAEKMKTEPSAFGTVNQINVVIDSEAYTQGLWDTLTYFFAVPYPILPQAEPTFDLRHLTLEKMAENPLTKELRTYIFLVDASYKDSQVKSILDIENINLEEKDYKIKVIEDRWAKGQKIFIVIGRNQAALLSAVHNGHQSIARAIRDADRELVRVATYMEGENETLNKYVQEKYHLDITFPGRYRKAIQTDTFAWFQFIQDKAINSIFLSYREYTGSDQFSKEFVQQWTEEMTSRYITTNQENSYMVINDIDLPVIYSENHSTTLYKGTIKAIWEMENAFMGGPIVSKLYYRPGDQRIYLIVGFVYAPGENKRNYMQRIEYILDHVRIVG